MHRKRIGACSVMSDRDFAGDPLDLRSPWTDHSQACRPNPRLSFEDIDRMLSDIENQNVKNGGSLQGRAKK